MAEKQNLLLESVLDKKSAGGSAAGPFNLEGLQRIWNIPQLSFLHEDKVLLQKNILERSNSFGREIDNIVTERASYQTLSPSTDETSRQKQSVKLLLMRAVNGAPALIIAILLNLFFGVSFGQAFFPTSWNFPDSVPRAIGVQMFLISTVICQITMTLTSSFPMAFGMMMVENIPFMHIICNIAIDAQGMGKDTFATVFVAFAISTISVGVFFYLLGHYQLGNVVYFFPKHVIVGCIGGIGVFLFTTGMEGSTNTTWKWDLDVITAFFSPALLPLWLTSLFFEFVLRCLSFKIKNPLLAPFFFVSIPFVFYAMLLITRTPIASAHQMGWFFQGVTGTVDPLLIWELIDFRLVNWMSILKSMPTIIALTIFSLMHVPINIPSLSISTGHPTDMNKELKAHGISNILSGCFGGLQNYVCYCNSVTYFKCNGGGIVSGLLLALSSSIFFFIGPSAVFFVPRCMAGCLLMHIGSDLTKEALWDSIGTFDVFEYGSVVAITIVMTAYGMTAGLALGVFCAALTFTLQTSRNVQPMRAIRSARTLRSSKWRSQQMNNVLDQHSKHVSVIQLQGHLFFGNASLLSAKVENMLQKAHAYKDIKFIVLDFTLVLAIDSSAAETIAKIYEVCAKYEVRLCYSRASPKGFPCVSKLTERIRIIASKDQLDAELKPSRQVAESESVSEKKRSKSDKKKTAREMYPISKSFNVDGKQPLKEKEFILENSSHRGDVEAPESRNQPVERALEDTVFVADSLDEGLAWCEDVIIREHLPGCDMDNLSNEEFLVEGKPLPAYLRRLHMLCPCESVDVVNSLFAKFDLVRVTRNTVLWRQGDPSDRAVMLCRGKLLSTLEEEGERLVTEDISVGHLVGEYGLINNIVRQGTLTAVEDSELYVLSKATFEKIVKDEPYLAFALSRICMAYLGHRVMHVSNRIWESRCLPV